MVVQEGVKNGVNARLRKIVAHFGTVTVMGAARTTTRLGWALCLIPINLSGGSESGLVRPDPFTGGRLRSRSGFAHGQPGRLDGKGGLHIEN